MTEAFIHKGLWWLPESPEKRIPGIIEYDPQTGITLDVMEPLVKVTGGVRDPLPIINGVLSDKRQEVTLWECLFVSGNLFPGQSALYKIQFAFLGHHFSSPSEIKFSTLSAQYENLNEWVNRDPFDYTTFEVGALGVSHKKPVRVETRLEEKTILITDGFGRQLGMHRAAVEHAARLQVTYDYSVDFHRISRDLDHMSDLVVLGVGSPIGRYELLGRVSANGGKVTIIDRHRHATRKLQERDIHFSDMLFCLPDLGDHADQIIKRWYECRETLDAVIPLYFSVIDAPSMYIETQFELLARTLEVYHRMRSKQDGDDLYLPEESFNRLLQEPVEKLIRNTPELANTQQIFVDKMEHWNEYSLRMRLKRILSELEGVFPHEIKRLLLDKRAFVDFIVTNRNNLVHQGTPQKAVDIDTYLQCIWQLKAIVVMCLLKELSIPAILGSKIIEKYEAYKLAVGDYWA